jgi:hypothetical protein
MPDGVTADAVWFTVSCGAQYPLVQTPWLLHDVPSGTELPSAHIAWPL